MAAEFMGEDSRFKELHGKKSTPKLQNEGIIRTRKHTKEFRRVLKIVGSYRLKAVLQLC